MQREAEANDRERLFPGACVPVAPVGGGSGLLKYFLVHGLS